MVNYTKIPLYYRKLSQDDSYYLVAATTRLLKETPISPEQDPRLHKGIEDLEKAIDSYDKVSQIKSATTQPRLTDLDKDRDRDFRDLRDYIQIQTRNRQSNKQAAAKKLQELFDPYRQLPKLSRSEQSSQLERLIKRCEEKDTRQLLRLIGAEDLLLNLKESHNIFEVNQLKKMEGKSQQATNLKRQSLENFLRIYKNIYRYLIALEEFDMDSYHRPALAIFNDVRLTFLEKQQKKARQEKKK